MLDRVYRGVAWQRVDQISCVIKMDLVKVGLGWCGSICLRIGTRESSCEHGNEHSGSIQCWKVLQLLHNWRLLKKG
jgi:hypothetical protein